MKKYSEEAISEKLLTIPSWKFVEGKLQKKFVFSNFKEAFAFMSKVAIFSEEINHHPEWSNVYNTVVIELVTHDSDGITALDFDLASKIDEAEHNTRLLNQIPIIPPRINI